MLGGSSPEGDGAHGPQEKPGSGSKDKQDAVIDKALGKK